MAGNMVGGWNDLRTGGFANPIRKQINRAGAARQAGAAEGVSTLKSTRDSYQPWMDFSTDIMGRIQKLFQDPSQVSELPGYQFRVDQGVKAVTNKYSGQQGTQSGAVLKALTDYGQGQASAEYDKELNRYFGAMDKAAPGVQMFGDVSKTLAEAQFGQGQANAWASESEAMHLAGQENYARQIDMTQLGFTNQTTSKYMSSGSMGGGGGGGGKIVCTAMNEAYGFGTFRNKIWLLYAAKYLTPYHEKGYHALFLPVVDYGFHRGNALPNRIVRVIAEHIARRRSVYLRSVLRKSKTDFLGHLYDFVITPLCYIVGRLVSK